MDMLIGQLAKAADLSVQTLRYYERRRLLTPALRRESGYRIYRDDAIKKLRFIKNAQALGFSLEEIRSLLHLRSAGAGSCAKVQRQAAAHSKDVKKRIERLRAIDRVLMELERTCRKRGRTDECPILKCLEEPR